MLHRYVSIGVGVLCLTVAALAQDNSPAETTNGSADRPDPHPKLLVSTYGKIVEGRISHTATGYMVDVAGGSFLIPFNMVKFTADSRHDAYLKYKKLMPEETPGNHVKLATWCIESHLLNDASHELKQALYLEPNSKEAARLLAYVERLKNGTGPAAAQPDSNNPPNSSGAIRKRAVSLNGLTPDTVSEYSTAIQPILINNCAKAGCHHSAADNSFRLEYVRLTGYGNRFASANNLANVVEQLDTDDPHKSPLLVRARFNHGDARNSLVMAPKGKEILARIERWVENASRELNPRPQPAATAATEPADAAIPSPRGRTIDRNSLPADEREFVRQILSRQQHDPFDPAQFNRTAHPSGN